jgi:hypothetical protein
MDVDIYSYVLAALLGGVLGALVNYLSDVLPYRRRLVRPFCLHCQQVMGWKNYLVWPRQCPSCNRRRSLRTWVVEIIFVAAALGIFARPPERLGIALGLLWLTYFGVITVIDIEHHLILHSVSWAGAGIGLVTGVWLHGWMSTMIGGLAGFGIMLIFYWKAGRRGCVWIWRCQLERRDWAAIGLAWRPGRVVHCYPGFRRFYGTLCPRRAHVQAPQGSYCASLWAIFSS